MSMPAAMTARPVAGPAAVQGFGPPVLVHELATALEAVLGQIEESATLDRRVLDQAAWVLAKAKTEMKQPRGTL